MNTSQYIFVQSLNNTWHYSLFTNAQPKQLTWQEIGSTQNLKDRINLMKEEHELNVISLPELKTIKSSAYNQIILISKGTKELFSSLFPEQINQFWEVDENIGMSGEVRKSLTEPEINKALRTIFRYRTKEAIFLLSNAAFNPLHQSNIKNVLHTAGVRSIIATPNLKA